MARKKAQPDVDLLEAAVVVQGEETLSEEPPQEEELFDEHDGEASVDLPEEPDGPPPEIRAQKWRVTKTADKVMVRGSYVNMPVGRELSDEYVSQHGLLLRDQGVVVERF